MPATDRTSETFKMEHLSFGAHNKIVLGENRITGCTPCTVQPKYMYNVSKAGCKHCILYNLNICKMYYVSFTPCTVKHKDI